LRSHFHIRWQEALIAILVVLIVWFMCSKYFRLLKSSVVSRGSKILFSCGDLKQVYLVRTDLEMGKGKIAAQCCHAAVKAFRELQGRGKEERAALDQWEWQGSRKVVVKVGSEEELQQIVMTALDKGLFATTIRDAGKTQIAAGSMTVGVIGPGNDKLIDEVSGHLKLL
jgi:PTH2 family peptidyl-tRNA hydrolase